MEWKVRDSGNRMGGARALARTGGKRHTLFGNARGMSNLSSGCAILVAVLQLRSVKSNGQILEQRSGENDNGNRATPELYFCKVNNEINLFARQ